MDPAGDELIFVRRIYTFCETLEFLENLKIMLFKWIKLHKINKTRAYQLISKIKIRSVQIKRMTTYSCVILCYFIMHSTEYRVSCVGCSWWIKIFPSFVSLDQRQSPQACSDLLASHHKHLLPISRTELTSWCSSFIFQVHSRTSPTSPIPSAFFAEQISSATFMLCKVMKVLKVLLSKSFNSKKSHFVK